MFRSAATIAAVVACAVAVAPATAQDAPSRPTSTSAVSEERPLRVPLPRDDGTLTPYTFELAYPVVMLVYDSLMWRDPNGIPQPWLAKSVTAPTGGRAVTITLERGVEWHDGEPLDAADVVFTFAYFKEHFHPRFTPELSNVAGVTALDDARVRIRLKHASLGFFDQPLADLPILPEHIWEKLGPGSIAPEGLPVGSGPYRMVEHRRDELYRLESNRDYFRGLPTPAAIELPIIPEVDETLEALEDGDVDVLPLPLADEQAGRLTGLNVAFEEGASYQGTALLFDTVEGPFANASLRRAVAAAIDLDRLVNAVEPAVPATSGYLHPDSRWAPDQRLHDFDETHAAELLGDSAPIEILVPSTDPNRREAGRQVMLALERAGAEASLRELPASDLAASVGEDGSTPDFDAAVWNVPALASYDPDFLTRIFGSDPDLATLNYSGYRSDRFDTAARRVARASTVPERRRAVTRELRVLADDAPAIPLYFPEGIFAYRHAIFSDWVYVKGTGILDKRSFLPHAGGTPEAPAPDDVEEAEPEGFPFGAVALVLAVAATLLAVGALATRRR